jgi:hypothetical protein
MARSRSVSGQASAKSRRTWAAIRARTLSVSTSLDRTYVHRLSATNEPTRTRMQHLSGCVLVYQTYAARSSVEPSPSHTRRATSTEAT